MTVELLRAIFGWGAVCNIVFLSVMFFVFLTGRDVIYSLHGRWFGISALWLLFYAPRTS